MTDRDDALREGYDRAARGFATALAGVGPSAWGDGTPCPEWTVRDLVTHVLSEQLWVPPLLAGETIEEIGDRFAGDQVGPDPLASWERARTQVDLALADSGVADRAVRLSYGDTTAATYVAEVTMDTLVHTWDLARAIGSDDRLDPAAVTAALAFVVPRLEAYRASGLFGPEVPVADDTDEQTRLLALLGRRS